ncbi:MAG: glutamyl-tRNA reductase [Burkholderiales bacterium]|jgi:glutamyl-tRNA reductase|nr:glutamyl-tRNA reductase [Nitrosomonadaceae bacterium]
MTLFALGLNHRTAPIEVRERLTFPPTALYEAIGSLKTATGAEEAMIVSTCNRTELYLRAMTADVIQRAQGWMAGLPQVGSQQLDQHLYDLAHAAVPRHAFRVASGLDSMVLGEPQILGQVKLAARVANDAKSLSGPLERMVRETISVAREVRSDTAIGRTSVSMAAVAARIAQQIFGELNQTRVLMIGAGEMIELAAAHFHGLNPKEIVIANRTSSKGEALAARFGASAMPLQDLRERMHQFDIVVTCTASTVPILGKGLVEQAMRRRRHQPMFIVDLAVPRDVEPEVAEIDEVFLQSLDSLGALVAQNLSVRESALQEADAIIERRTTEFMRWLANKASVPFIQEVRSQAEEYSAVELARAQRQLANGGDPQKVLESLARALVNKMLHPSLTAINHAEPEKRESLIDAARELLIAQQSRH